MTHQRCHQRKHGVRQQRRQLQQKRVAPSLTSAGTPLQTTQAAVPAELLLPRPLLPQRYPSATLPAAARCQLVQPEGQHLLRSCGHCVRLPSLHRQTPHLLLRLQKLQQQTQW